MCKFKHHDTAPCNVIDVELLIVDEDKNNTESKRPLDDGEDDGSTAVTTSITSSSSASTRATVVTLSGSDVRRGAAPDDMEAYSDCVRQKTYSIYFRLRAARTFARACQRFFGACANHNTSRLLTQGPNTLALSWNTTVRRLFAPAADVVQTRRPAHGLHEACMATCTCCYRAQPALPHPPAGFPSSTSLL